MTDVPFPVMSGKDPEAQGVVATWFVADGEQVTEGDLLAEVAVGKVDVEITAPASGTIRLLVEEEGIAKQGTIIARID